MREFLTAQSLTILPQNSFGDAVSQFVDKDDKHAMELFVSENLTKQVESLMKMDNVDEDNIRERMEEGKSHLEELFASGHLAKLRKAKRKPRPANWDSDLNGAWDDQPAAIIRSDLEDEEDSDISRPASKPTTNGRVKVAPKRASAPAKKAAPPAKNSRSKKKVVESESEEEDEDVVMLDSDDDESQLFVKPEPPTRGSKKSAPVNAPATKRAPTRGAVANQASRQSQLNFSQPASQSRGKPRRLRRLAMMISLVTTMLSSLHRPHDLRGAEDKAYHMSRTVNAMASTQCILNCVQSIYSMASRSRGFSKRCTVSIVQNLMSL